MRKAADHRSRVDPGWCVAPRRVNVDGISMSESVSVAACFSMPIVE